MTTTINKIRAKHENYLATKKHCRPDSLKRARVMVLVAAFSILGAVIPSSLAAGFFERVIQHVEQLPQAIIKAPEAVIDETKVIVQDTTTAVQNATEEVIKLEHQV